MCRRPGKFVSFSFAFATVVAPNITFGGEFGSGPGQINCAHNCAYAEGKLVVCDRNNSRFHIFDAETTDLLETW